MICELTIANMFYEEYNENFLGYLFFINNNDKISVAVVLKELDNPRLEESIKILNLLKTHISIANATIITLDEVKKFINDKKTTETFGRILLIYDRTGEILRKI